MALSLQNTGNSLPSLAVDLVSGVPQGSHLGPLLFNLFENDIKSVISSKFLMFADDMKVFAGVQSLEDQLNLQHCLNNIADWCEANAMDLNITKCSAMSFKRGLTAGLSFDHEIAGFKLNVQCEIQCSRKSRQD
ncbi:uncharacterized protein LOC128989079 [Macrosteles quadrilineatus]|uniref:uncharacterized protein LOC128989079 n=1 Tax=Macrosteles quadrilineatus TaxID=74068 RepID=UPI0023E1FC4A|nr:uncharacterized protein LOC128989079 [Macrosteles quadrilineatus]